MYVAMTQPSLHSNTPRVDLRPQKSFRVFCPSQDCTDSPHMKTHTVWGSFFPKPCLFSKRPLSSGDIAIQQPRWRARGIPYPLLNSTQSIHPQWNKPACGVLLIKSHSSAKCFQRLNVGVVSEVWGRLTRWGSWWIFPQQSQFASNDLTSSQHQSRLTGASMMHLFSLQTRTKFLLQGSEFLRMPFPETY